MPTRTNYLDYLRNRQATVSNEFYNQCHNPSGPAGGQFCSDNVDFTGMDLLDKPTTDKLRKTIAVISKVHDLPENYPKAYVEFDITNRLGTADGSYRADGEQIILSQGQTGTEITFVHEFGHHVTLAEEGNYSLDQFQDKIDRTPTLRAWRDAAQASPTYENIRRRFLDDGEDYAGYLNDERELFARSYAQWIARRSRDATLNDQLERNRSKNRDFQWPDDEFTPIAEALDDHFIERRHKHIAAAATQLANTCHDPDTGRFCGKEGHPTPTHLDKQIKDLQDMIAEYEGMEGSERVVDTLKKNLKALQAKKASGAKTYHGADLYVDPRLADFESEQATKAIKKTMDIVAEIHEPDPSLQPVRIGKDEALRGGTLGQYRPAFNSIGLQDVNDAFSLVHELGHWQTLNPNFTLEKGGGDNPSTHFLSNVNELGLGNVYYTITQSKAIKAIHARATHDGYAQYLDLPHERYARAYAQYIATKSSDPTLKAQFETFRRRNHSNDVQWSDTDFTPIFDAFDEYYQGRQDKRIAANAAFHLEGQHDQSTHGNRGSGGERTIPVKPYHDEAAEFDRVAALEKHYGRKEMAPEMGGVQWAFAGGSPPITEAAKDVLEGYDYDPYDRYSAYDRASYEAANTILKTIENESSDVPLYSGHRRGRDFVDAILEEGSVDFPLVATSPEKDLADVYADSKRDSPGDSVAIVYEFPPGSQAGFYQYNEHIASGEYEIESHTWFDENVIDIKLRQTQRSIVPPKRDLYEDEDRNARNHS